jgi:hypothetical protein
VVFSASKLSLFPAQKEPQREPSQPFINVLRTIELGETESKLLELCLLRVTKRQQLQR